MTVLSPGKFGRPVLPADEQGDAGMLGSFTGLLGDPDAA